MSLGRPFSSTSSSESSPEDPLLSSGVPEFSDSSELSSLMHIAQSFFSEEQVSSTTESTSADDLHQAIHKHANALQPLLISIRRLLHRYPELMYQERLTSQIVQRILTEMGVTDFR